MPLISYDGAMAELRTMFPQFNDDLFASMIQQHNGNMESIITSLLVLCDDSHPDVGSTPGFQTPVHFSYETESELRNIEMNTGLNLHRTWSKRLPDDFLLFSFFPKESDDEIARRLQNEFDEQASQNYIQRGLFDTPQAPVSRQTTEQESSFKSAASSLKNKFINFFTERRGYRRVNTQNPEEDTQNVEMRNM